MRAGCPRGSRVRTGVPHVLPFLHESLRRADARKAARLPTMESLSLVWNKAFLSALCFFCTATVHRHTNYNRGLERHWSSRISHLHSIAGNIPQVLTRPFSFLSVLTFLKQKVFSCLLKTVQISLKTQIVWGVSGVNSGKHPNNWETLIPPE